MTEIAPRIVVDENIRFGKPVIAGTRVPVDVVVGKLASGMTVEQVMTEYELARADVLAALSYAANAISDERIWVPPTANPESDRTGEIEPPLKRTVPWRVVTVQPLPGSRLHVEFADGTSGVVELERFLSKKEVDGTVFEPLREPEVFASARIVYGAVEWPNGADLAPDAMYDAIRQNGRWVLS